MKKDYSKKSPFIEGWSYYDHAMIPNTPPHLQPNMNPIYDKSIWLVGTNKPLFIRYTTNFDCNYLTEWWYCIKDNQFNKDQLNSKQRYEINKGNKYFYVKVINPSNYINDLFEIQNQAFMTYPKKYRPISDYNSFMKLIDNWNNKQSVVFGAFSKSDNSLCGYAQLKDNGDYCSFNVLKVNPCYERFAINAVIIQNICEYFNKKFSNFYYIMDGARNINHETSFHDYLIKYFNFRKAYCNLNIIYSSKIKWIIFLIYPIRKLLYCFDKIKIVHKINGILKMENIIRNQKKRL